MPKKIPVELGSMIFTSKKEAKEVFRQIVARYADGERIAPEDDAVLRDLLCLHPEQALKFGGGVSHFTVATDSEWGRTRHFVIVRLDGSSTDFSYHTCIDGNNWRQDILAALRFAIKEQVVDFKQDAFRNGSMPTCAYHSIPLTEDNAHVDHVAPRTFLVLVEEWLRAKGLTLQSLFLVDNADNQLVRELGSSAHVLSWRGFHRKHAQLRMISKRANLSEARKKP